MTPMTFGMGVLHPSLSPGMKYLCLPHHPSQPLLLLSPKDPPPQSEEPLKIRHRGFIVDFCQAVCFVCEIVVNNESFSRSAWV